MSSISFANALGVHEAALKVRGQRAAVLANNLANADTPNFKARDVDFKSLLADKVGASDQLSMRSTQQSHMAISSMEAGNEALMYRTPMQPSIDGNTVEEQVEHAAYMKNSMDFQASFTFLNSKFKGLMTAIRGE